MVAVSADTDIRNWSIDEQGVRLILGSTPLAAYADAFVSFARSYQIDPNLVLSYLHWENAFGTANTFALPYNNPFDIVCGSQPDCAGGSRPYGAADCRPGEPGLCQAVYSSMPAGIEAGFRLFSGYVARGLTTWSSVLNYALCGSTNCGSDWPSKVIAKGADNATRYPSAEGGAGPSLVSGRRIDRWELPVLAGLAILAIWLEA